MAELLFVAIQPSPFLGLLQEPGVAEKWLYAIWAQGNWMVLRQVYPGAPPMPVVLRLG